MTDMNETPEPVENSGIPFGEVPELPHEEAAAQSLIIEQDKKNANTATWVIILLLVLLLMILCTCCGAFTFAGGIRNFGLNHGFKNIFAGMELFIPLFAGML